MSPYGQTAFIDDSDQRLRLRLLYAPTGPASEYLDSFEKLLTREGYARKSIQRKLKLAADFSAWLKMRNISRKHLTHDCARCYLRYRSHRRC